jgi:hypothetical protein
MSSNKSVWNAQVHFSFSHSPPFPGISYGTDFCRHSHIYYWLFYEEEPKYVSFVPSRDVTKNVKHGRVGNMNWAMIKQINPKTPFLMTLWLCNFAQWRLVGHDFRVQWVLSIDGGKKTWESVTKMIIIHAKSILACYCFLKIGRTNLITTCWSIIPSMPSVLFLGYLAGSHGGIKGRKICFFVTMNGSNLASWRRNKT